jgi:hypothetical protein
MIDERDMKIIDIDVVKVNAHYRWRLHEIDDPVLDYEIDIYQW